MKTTRFAALILGAALIGTSVLATTPATAQALSFSNTLATPSAADQDITSVDVDYGDTTVSVTAHTQNYNLNSDFDFTALVGNGSSGLVAGGNPIFISAEYAGGSTSTEAYIFNGGGGTPLPGATVTFSRNLSANTVTVTITTAGLNLNDQIYAAAFIDDGGSSRYAGTFYGGSDIGGFGPVLKGTPATTTALELTWPTQLHNGTPVLAKATVSPASAAGSIQFFDGATLLGTVPYAGTAVYFALPSGLASGAHSITAKYIPPAPGGYLTSTSAAVPLTVLSAAKATETTVSLSTSTQKYKKTAAKLTVKVSGKPAGSVVIKDGKKTLKTVALKKGVAKYTFSKKLKKGSHKITATFMPADIEALATSTSKSVTLKVKK